MPFLPVPFHPKAVANYLLGLGQRDGVPLSPMKMIKLVYLAHGWHLALLDEPLINEQIEAWPYGPVISSLYHELKGYGNKPIESPLLRGTHSPKGFSFSPHSLGDGQSLERRLAAENLIDAVWNTYKNFSAVQLSAMTHQTDSPWHRTWHEGGGSEMRGTDIPQNDNKQHFQHLADE